MALHGKGFTTNFHEELNVVAIGTDTLGWTACDVIQGACTVDCGSTFKVVCDTQPFPVQAAGQALSVKASVMRSGIEVFHSELRGVFTCDAVSNTVTTPTLVGVSPRHVSVNWAVNLSGSSFGSDIKEYRVVYVGEGRPPSGGNLAADMGVGSGGENAVTHALCRPQALNRGMNKGFEKQVHTQVVMQEDYQPLSITKDFFRCEMGDFAAGSYNVSVHVAKGLAWANPSVPEFGW